MLANSAACFSKAAWKYTLTAWPNRMGSETFIMVALRCNEANRPSALALSSAAA